VKIINKGYEDFKDHREDFETCPLCSTKRDHKAWRAAAHTLCLEPSHVRVDSVAIISTCPKCKTDSWVHEPMSMFGVYSTDWPKGWNMAVKKHEAKIKLQALRDWGKSICWHCRSLSSGTVAYHAWRHCAKGSGPAEQACEGYQKMRGYKGYGLH